VPESRARLGIRYVLVESPRDEEADRERRRRTLSELAQRAGTPAASHAAVSRSPIALGTSERPAGSKRPRRRTRGFIVAAVVLALAVVAALVLPRFLTTPKRPAPSVD
jgi:hypothetical protein